MNKPKLPGFDLTEIMILLDGNESELFEILTMFKEDFENSIEDIFSYIEKNDFNLAYRQVHQLKGVAANIGADQLYSVSEPLEQLLKNNKFDVQIWQAWCDKFNECMETILGYLNHQS